MKKAILPNRIGPPRMSCTKNRPRCFHRGPFLALICGMTGPFFEYRFFTVSFCRPVARAAEKGEHLSGAKGVKSRFPERVPVSRGGFFPFLFMFGACLLPRPFSFLSAFAFLLRCRSRVLWIAFRFQGFLFFCVIAAFGNAFQSFFYMYCWFFSGAVGFFFFGFHRFVRRYADCFFRRCYPAFPAACGPMARFLLCGQAGVPLPGAIVTALELILLHGNHVLFRWSS